MKRLTLTLCYSTLAFALGCGGSGTTSTTVTEAGTDAIRSEGGAGSTGRSDGSLDTPAGSEAGPGSAEVGPEATAQTDGPDLPDATDVPLATPDGIDVPPMMPDMMPDMMPMPDMVPPPLPACAIAKPTKTKLNGVAAPMGDRASVAGADYQAAFEIATDAEDGQLVRVEVAPAGSPGTITPVTIAAMGGKATFPGVTFKPDGDYLVEAVCTNQAGGTRRTGKTTFSVDSTPPDLTVTNPVDNRHFNLSELVAGKFQVCGTTTALDAVNQPMSMLMGNFCAAIGSASPTCANVAPAMGGGAGCVDVTCPGGAAFTLNVALSDGAGNPTQKTVLGVSCSLTMPSVQIVSPTGDMTPFLDMSKRVLAATATQSLKDLDGTTAGAQTNVSACTDQMGGTARLFAGTVGGMLTMVGAPLTVVAAQMNDNCPAGLGFVAKFTSVTLPESTLDASGNLTAATQLRVDVADATMGTGSSPLVNVWVDSIAPTVAITSPNPFCGTSILGTPNTTATVQTMATPPNVVLTLTNGSATAYSMPTVAGNLATFTGVLLRAGTNAVTAAVTDPAGNTGSLAAACNVAVFSNPPAVVIVTPSSTITSLCANGTVSTTCVADGDVITTNGWQGTLAARVSLDGVLINNMGTVTFNADTTVLGTANIDATGTATLAVTTPGVPEGAAITITATSSNISGRGAGTTSRTFPVDVNIPSGPVVSTAVKSRRQTSFTLSWPVPADLGNTGIGGYDVRHQRMASSAVDCAAFVFNTATQITFTGSPVQTGTQTFDVSNFIIENRYCFGVAARDNGGNLGPVGTTATPAIANFNVSTLTPPTAVGNEQFGFRTDGSNDINGNPSLPLTDETRLSDLLVGSATGNRAFIYLGTSGGTSTYPSTPAPNVTINRFDATLANFGGSVAHIGNFDGDSTSPPEIAVAAYGSGKVYIFKGRTSWPATLDERNADWVIQTDTTADPNYTGSFFGFTMTRLGNFDNDTDGSDDFAIGAFIYGPSSPSASTRQGRVIIVKGRRDTRIPGASTVTINVPETISDRIIELPEPNASAFNRPQFGTAMVGLGRYYTDGPGTTLVVSATGLGSSTSLSENFGRIYAYRMLANGSVTLGPGTNPLIGAAKGDKIGGSLTNLGVLTGTLPNLGIGSTTAAITVGASMYLGTAQVCNGTADAAPWTNRTTLYSSAAANPAQVIFGGAMPGSATTLSLFGDSIPEVAVSGSFSSGSLYIVNGSTVAALTSPADLETSAQVKISLPLPWSGTAPTGGLLRDVNGDGYADFAVADANTTTVPGKVAVYW